MNRHALIRAALDALSFSGVSRMLPGAPDAAGFVVTLHHVMPAGAASFDPNALLSVTPDFLDQFIAHFSSCGWRFVSVDDLVGAGEGSPKRIAITLDDGYRDNLQHAWPIFQKHRAPFTIFVCPGFTERRSELWWEALAQMIAAADAFPIPGEESDGGRPVRTLAEKMQMFSDWRIWLTTIVDEAHQRIAIRALAEKHDLDLSELAHALVMDWDETRRIAADPLCSIGAHTMTHAALARLSAEAALQEIVLSADRIAAEIGSRPTSIAFPYGYPAAAGPREAKLAAEAGLASSFTTQPGYIRSTGSRHSLPRVSVNGLFQRIRYLETLLNPGLWVLRNRLRKAA
jgi:peptidoglycan/xylan/chitin deacetylase (PgdA/CDA1 family)